MFQGFHALSVRPYLTSTDTLIYLPQCLGKLPTGSGSGVKHPKLLDELATERILTAYSSEGGGESSAFRAEM